ncbi:MAG: hypothetical protein RBS82_03590 [Syntrophales bacterium]|jgi:hypothetical protein|nr:hypothetical protein [Syntrophales bacterium]
MHVLSFQERNIAVYLSVFFVVLFMAALVHQAPAFAGSVTGHLFGITGGAFMLMALAYPFRKRILNKRGVENPLTRHILYGLGGPSLGIIHSAHTFGSLIGILLLAATFAVVLSGITGFFLYRKVSRTLHIQKKDRDILKKRLKEEREGARACLLLLEKLGDAEEEELERRCHETMDLAHSVAEMEYTVSVFSKMKNLFSFWYRVHYVLALALFSFLTVHIATIVYYGIRWL